MNRMIGLILPTLLFLNGTSLGQDKKGDKQIQGTWTVVSVLDSGRDEKEKKDLTCVITKDTITMSQRDRNTESLKYTVDPSKNPKWFTFTTKRDKTLPGIYELMGDTLRICFNEGQDRATKFVSERGSANEVLIVLRRKKKAKENLLFASNRDGKNKIAIYTMSSDGSNQKKLTKKEEMAFDPVFSPDRRRILFAAMITSDGAQKSAIFVMNADGSARKQLTDKDELAFGPAWSPDGKRIAFSTMDTKDPPPKSHLFVMDADGKNRKALGRGLLPKWSPDGKKVAYSVMGERGRPSQRIMDADGKNSRSLVEGTAMMAVWSPDGKKILYMGEVGENQVDLFVMNADGTKKERITKSPEVFEIGPQWSADGKRVYFARSAGTGRPEEIEIFVIDANGKNEKQLTDNQAMDVLGGGSMLLLMRGSSRDRPKDQPSS